MTINLHIPAKLEHLRPTITVIGVGGAGGNAVNNMIASNLEGVNFIVANTDAQALDHSLTERTIQLGAGITKGLGAGANPNIGRDSAEEARDEISAYIEGSNMVFITAGMGGGTGTGAAAVVARLAKEQGILTVAVVTKPFQFEGKHRMCLAEEGLKELQNYVDTLIVIPNQNLFRIANERTTFADAFKMADEVLHSGVRGVTDLMVKPGLINLDFADIRTVMREMGKAMMGTGEASGERRAVEAAESAISNPLLDDVSLKGARALLVNVTGGLDMTLFEVDEALNRVREEVDPDANIIFGSTFNEDMAGKMRVSVVATGIDAQLQNNTGTNKSASSADTKKPYSFGTSMKPEPIKASPRVAPVDNIRDRDFLPTATRPQVEQRLGGAVRFETPVEEYAQENSYPIPNSVINNAELNAIIREHSVSYSAQENQQTKQTATRNSNAAPQKQPQAQMRENPQLQTKASGSARGFFKRIADAGRALSTRHDEEREDEEYQEPRVHIVQKPLQAADSSVRSSKIQNDDQYLDIPAFLRRQAN